MKSIVGGLLEYRNADCGQQHIHESDMTSSQGLRRVTERDSFSICSVL
jgi:hypothetical protein